MLFEFFFPTAEHAKVRCIGGGGSVAGGHTMQMPGMSVAGLCARFAPTIKWQRIALWGGGGSLWPPRFTKQ